MTVTRQLPKAGTASDQRLFIAIPCAVNPSVDSELNELRAARVEGLRTVDRDTLHVTLKFLGATASSKIPAIGAVLDAELRDVAPFTVQLAGTGCFPNALWLGVRPDPDLAMLADHLDRCMQALGFQGEMRAFKPHVTLARIKRHSRFPAAQWQQRKAHRVWGNLPVSAVNLYRSTTTPAGAVYTILHSAELSAG